MFLDMPPQSVPENPIQIVQNAQSGVRRSGQLSATTDSMRVQPLLGDDTMRSAMEQIVTQFYVYYLKPEPISNIEEAAHRFGVLFEHHTPTMALNRIEGSANFQVPKALQEVLVKDAKFLAISGKRLQIRFAFNGDAPCLDTEHLRSVTQWSGWGDNFRFQPRFRAKKAEFPDSKTLSDPTWRDGLSRERVLSYTTDKTGCVRQLYLRVDALRN